MSPWCWLVVGVLASGPVWVLLTLWVSRRTWRLARRMTARAKGHDQLMELGQLAGGLAHEIKNPLSTINVNLKLLAEDLSRRGDESGRVLPRLRSVQDEAARLRGILDDFLRFAGRMELSPTILDLRRLVDELADFFRPQAEAARVVLRTALPEQPVRASVDGDLIKQALLNLMINAVQAMPQGGDLLIRLGVQKQKAVIEVIDTGAGVAPEDLQRLFQVFYSTKKRGMGLGLPTTRRIIREHDGTIRVESEVGKGTRFIFTLPLVKNP